MAGVANSGGVVTGGESLEEVRQVAFGTGGAFRRVFAETIGPIMPILTQNAENAVKEGLGKGLATHGLPKNMIAIPERLLDMSSMFGAKK